MKRVEIAENRQVEVRLTPEQGHALAASDIVTAVPSPYDPQLWRIKPSGRVVGVARVGDVEIWITPKLPIARLLFLAGYAKRPSGWREEDVELGIAEGLVPAVARSLCHQAEHALRQGPLHGYRTVEESSAVLRGRLREADQLRKHHGRAIPMEMRYDDFTIDMPENQILLAAIIRMAGVPRVRDEYRRQLVALRAALAGVTVPERGASLPSWHPNRLNQRYHTVLRLAEVVWQATSPEHTRGALLAHGFLFNLWKIFEDFLIVALSEELQTRHGGRARGYSCRLDEAGAVEMKPDLVWQVNGQPVAVIDAKYKQEQPSGYPYADLYQVLAYCTALRLPRGHLVYARGNADPARHVVRYSGIEIVCHALDLTLPPAKLLAQVGDIADELVANSPAA
ncbi:MAG: restriction endonuclease [Pseudonocardiales bacterium]|nr:McrC family protein [Actinomycetota bacterium]PZS14737.1 MAG: restriction endonuclease [Pseudonocardiales bacterium]